MDRREALSIVSVIAGGTVVGAGNFLAGCKSKESKSIFGLLSQENINLTEEIAETILPKTTTTPGAKDVAIGKFFNTIVSDCYNAEEQQSFLDGLSRFNELCIEKVGDDFQDLNPEKKEEVILHLEEESRAYNQNRPEGQPVHYYSMVKQLSIWGYLSSEKVGTQVLRHIPIPERFEGCIDYQKGEKSYI